MPILTGPINVDQHAYDFAGQVMQGVSAAPKGSTIRIVQYLLDLADVTDTIVEAHRRGVHVQVVMNHGVLLRAGWTGVQTRKLQAELGTDRKAASWIYSCRSSCFKSHAGHMHAKMVLFSQTGSQRQIGIVGSANLAGTNTWESWNEEQVFTRQRIYYGLVRYFNAMATDGVKPHGRHVVSGDQEMWFYPSVPNTIQLHLLAVRAKDGCRVDVANFIFSDGAVEKARRLRALWVAGCQVRVALNLSDPSPHVGTEVARILFTPYRGRVMPIWDTWKAKEDYSHLKTTLVYDRKLGSVVYGGSANFTGGNRRDNADILTLNRDLATYRAYVGFYDELLTDSTRWTTLRPGASTSKHVSESALGDGE